MKTMNEITYIVASDVQLRDGIGVEFYRNGELFIEIFRDDRAFVRTVKLFTDSLELQELEYCIEVFKAKIPPTFQNGET